MCKNHIKWHPYPQEQIPKNIKNVFITIKDSLGIYEDVLIIEANYIDLFNYDTVKVIAWAEVFDYYKKPTKKSENSCDWIENTFKNSPTQGNKVITYIKFSDRISRRYVDILYSAEGRFPNVRGINILAWAELPDPYEEENCE